MSLNPGFNLTEALNLVALSAIVEGDDAPPTGIVGALNCPEFLTGRIEGSDVIAPLIPATAVVIRFIKTRAEIAGWNKS